MWPVYLFSMLVVCIAVPINRNFSTNNRAIYVDKSNEKFGNESVCISDDVLYKEGDTMPTTNVCETCICRPPRFMCQDIKCEMKPGCRVAQRPNTCCPEYQCECERDGKFYQNGERLDDVDSPCQACYCQSGEIVCTIIECYRRDDCEPRYVNGTCCPKYDHCPPLEPTPMTLYTSTSKQQEDTSEHNLQDNAIDSSKRIDILEEILSDSPYLAAPASFQRYDDEILEENMSEVYTQRSTITLQSDDETTLQVNDTSKTSTNDKNEESHEQIPQDNTSIQSETEKIIDHDDTIPETLLKQDLIKHGSAEMTTLSAYPADTMLGDEQPSQYPREIKHFNSDKSESSEETTSKENIVTTIIVKYKDSEGNSNEKSAEDETETIPSTTTTPEEDEIPVLTIKSGMSAENMSIVIPQLITTKMGYEEESSLVHNDPLTYDNLENKSTSGKSQEVTTHSQQLQEPNKNEEKSNTDASADTEEENQSEMMHDDPVLVKKLKETTPTSVLETKTPNNTEETSTEREEISTISQFSDDNIIKTGIETGTTNEVTETTESVEVVSTTPNFLEGEHPGNRRNVVSESESTSDITDSSNSNDVPSTPPNVLEDEYLELKESDSAEKEKTNNDEVPSTTPDIFGGEHPENRRYYSSDTTNSDEALLTISNVLESEHPETRSDSFEAADTTSSDETLSTTPNVLDREHPGIRSSGQSTETTSDYYISSTVPNFLEGEHPDNRSDDLVKSTTSGNLGDDSYVKEIVSGELSEPDTETEVSVSAEKDDISENRGNITSQSSEKTTSIEEMTTYSTTVEVTAMNDDDDSVKILQPVSLINKTFSGEVMSDKDESLPEKWLKLQKISNSSMTADHELLAKEEIKTESNSTEITTEVPATTSTLKHDEHSELFYKSSEKYKILNDETTVTSNIEREEEKTTTISSAETEIPTEEIDQWGNSEEKTGSNKYERHTLLSKEEPLEIKPIYVASYGSSGSNEQMFSTAEIYGDYYVSSKENKTVESNEASTQTQTDLSTESTSTEVPSSSKEDDSNIQTEVPSSSKEDDSNIQTEVPSSSKEDDSNTQTEVPSSSKEDDPNIQTEEISSNEYIDSFSGETTTVFSNNTETTINKNDTETTTPKSFNDSNYNEIDASRRAYPSWETLNSQNEDTYVKEVHDYGSKFNHEDFFEDSGLVLE